MAHYQERLDRDLTRIRTSMRDVGQLARKAMQNAIRAFLTGNENLAHQTVINDNPINRATREIDALCHEFIAVHLPTAGHLRLMSSVIRADIALERIGDYAVTICREGLQLSAPPDNAVAREMEMMAQQSLEKLDKAVEALYSSDEGMARAAMAMGGRLKTTLDGIYDDLLEDSGNRPTRDIVAMFVVFNMLKRVSDQAKNLCEEALFAISGVTKPPRKLNILFVDEDNALMSQMAAAIGRRKYSHLGTFHSAGREPAKALDSRLLRFMGEHGAEMEGERPRRLKEGTDLSKYDVVISLQGRPRDLLPELPFHTSALEWDVGGPDANAAAGDEHLEQIYRQLSVDLRELVETLWGKVAEK